MGGGKKGRGDRARRRAAPASPSAEEVSEPANSAGAQTKIEACLWWRASPGARSPVLEAFQALPTEGRAGLTKQMERYKMGQARPGLHVKNIGDGILELRMKRTPNVYRLLFTRWGGNAVIVDVFIKKKGKTEKRLAMQRAAAWRRTYPNPPQPTSGDNKSG